MDKTSNQVDDHIDYIDSCKAIGILLVILGHTYFLPEWLYVIIYSFHMPLFFIISGMLFNESKYTKGTFTKFVFVKFKSYVLPYFGYAFINLLLQVVFKAVFNKTIVGADYIFHNIKGILLCYANLETMPNCSPLWFLMCLFISSVVFWIIMNYAKKYAGLSAVFCMALSYLLYLFVDFWFPWNIPTALMSVFFMYLGHLIKKYDAIGRLKKTKATYLVMIILTAIGIIAALLNGKTVGMNGNTYGNLLLFLISSVTLSYVLLVLCAKLSFLKNRFLTWLGKNTMFIIAFNYFMRDFTVELYYMTPYIKNFRLNWVTSFAITAIGCFVGILLYNNLIKKLLHRNSLFSKKRTSANN